MVLLDAAKGCGTAPPDLTRFPADFVAISFYKVNLSRVLAVSQTYELHSMDLCMSLNSYCLWILTLDFSWRMICLMRVLSKF